MAHGLETRVPFLDNDLVDFAQRAAGAAEAAQPRRRWSALNENEPGPKTERYFERTRDGKLLLRQVMERYVPEPITDQVKQGFSGPDASWFRGDSIDYVRGIAARPPTRRSTSSSTPTAVRPLVDDHLEGRENRRLLIWSLLTFEHWCRTFLHGAPTVMRGRKR